MERLNYMDLQSSRDRILAMAKCRRCGNAPCTCTEPLSTPIRPVIKKEKQHQNGDSKEPIPYRKFDPKKDKKPGSS